MVKRSDRTVLVIGASGMVGSRFVELYGGDNFLMPSSRELDITDKERVRKFLKDKKLAVIVNFADYTNVGKAEEQRDDRGGECYRINVLGVENIIDLIDPEKTHFVHISTDMVFSGRSENPGPYLESILAEEKSAKLTWYGFTKAEAERRVLSRLGERASIVRIIYPVRAKYEDKLDYLRGPLKKYREGSLYPLFSDQQISITFIDELSDALANIVANMRSGVFHVCSSDTTTPYELISKFICRVEGRKVELDSSPMGELEGRYPRYGGLDSKKTQEVLGMRFRSTDEIIEELILQGVSV